MLTVEFDWNGKPFLDSFSLVAEETVDGIVFGRKRFLQFMAAALPAETKSKRVDYIMRRCRGQLVEAQVDTKFVQDSDAVLQQVKWYRKVREEKAA